MISVINNLKQGGYHKTAHIYKNSLNAFIAFNEGKKISFDMITPELLKSLIFISSNRDSLHRHSIYSDFTGNATISCNTLTAVSTFGTSFINILRRPFCSRKSQRRVYFIM